MEDATNTGGRRQHQSTTGERARIGHKPLTMHVRFPVEHRIESTPRFLLAFIIFETLGENTRTKIRRRPFGARQRRHRAPRGSSWSAPPGGPPQDCPLYFWPVNLDLVSNQQLHRPLFAAAIKPVWQEAHERPISISILCAETANRKPPVRRSTAAI